MNRSSWSRQASASTSINFLKKYYAWRAPRKLEVKGRHLLERYWEIIERESDVYPSPEQTESIAKLLIFCFDIHCFHKATLGESWPKSFTVRQRKDKHGSSVFHNYICLILPFDFPVFAWEENACLDKGSQIHPRTTTRTQILAHFGEGSRQTRRVPASN